MISRKYKAVYIFREKSSDNKKSKRIKVKATVLIDISSILPKKLDKVVEIIRQDILDHFNIRYKDLDIIDIERIA